MMQVLRAKGLPRAGLCCAVFIYRPAPYPQATVPCPPGETFRPVRKSKEVVPPDRGRVPVPEL